MSPAAIVAEAGVMLMSPSPLRPGDGLVRLAPVAADQSRE
jgi:hypothetical protein